MIESILDAIQIEQMRIEDPRNRTRYFIFGKVSEVREDEGISFTFRSAPDRAMRDARWAGPRGEEKLFRVGGGFLTGFMALSPEGLVVGFPFSELEAQGVEEDWLSEVTGRGIEYVMDNRDFIHNLEQFLMAHDDWDESFLQEVLRADGTTAIKPIASPEHFPDLNDSQRSAIDKCLSQKVTFIWGPPGTGKTKTMAALATCLVRANKRVLVTALSNMALDQLLLSTVERLGEDARKTAIARTGSHMDKRARKFSKMLFERGDFGGKRAGPSWPEHLEEATLVAANFAMLTFPHAAHPGMFDYVISDEISMANVPNLAATMCFAKRGMVLGGDPYQLPPIFPEDTEIPNEWFRQNVFEKAGITDRHDPRVAFLDTQYRMQEGIGSLVSDLFYDGELRTGAPEVAPIETFPGPVVFMHAPGSVGRMDEYGGAPGQRRFNETHADAVVRAVEMALEGGVTPWEIGIITPYNAQVVLIARRLADAGVQGAGRIKVSTVHSFQGQERRLIIVDITDDDVPPTRLTAKWELINVALSRAKEQLVIVGNKDYLVDAGHFGEREIEMFRRMLGHAQVF